MKACVGMTLALYVSSMCSLGTCSSGKFWIFGLSESVSGGCLDGEFYLSMIHTQHTQR